MNTSIRIVFSFCFVILCFLSPQFAVSEEKANKPDKSYSVFYKVENFTKKETMVQEYAFEIYSNPEPHYVVQIKNNSNKKVIATEAETYWNKITTVEGQDYYIDLGLSENIATIQKDSSLFGRMELKSMYDHAIINAWPVFGNVKTNKDLYILTLTGYMHGGGKLIITTVYGQYLHHIPIHKRVTFLDSKGVVVSDLQSTLM